MPLPSDHNIALIKTIQHITDANLEARWAYYRGDIKPPYLTKKLRDTFGDLADSFVENYCSLAIDARIDRLEVTGFDGPGENVAQQIWDEGGFRQKQDQWFRWGLVGGSCYLIVQDDTIVANPSKVAWAEPATDDWLGVKWAGKAWQSDEGDRFYASLWDEENIYHYATPPGSANEWLSQRNWNVTITAGSMEYLGEERHGYGQVPVFPINPYGDGAAPLIDKIAPIQDTINKIIANQMTVLEWSAFKQRVFFTQQQIDPYDLRQEPDTAIILDPGSPDAKASVIELGGSDIGGYSDLKDKTIDALFTVASLPRHMRVNPASPPSGEAIKSDESPFVKSIRNHQREYGQAFQMALNLIGVQAEPVWADPETRNELSASQVFETVTAAGVPWQTAAIRYLGFTPDEVDEAMMMKQAEQSGPTPPPFGINEQTAAFLANPLL